MKKFALYAAAAAVAMTGTTAITSQAAVSVYAAGGNCGGWSGGNSWGSCGNTGNAGYGSGCGNTGSTYYGSSCGSTGNTYYGNSCGNTGNACYGSGCSAEDIFQMMFPSCSWSDCFGGWGGSCENPVLPDCSGTWGGCWEPECPDFWDCTGNETPDVQPPESQNPGTGTPGTENPGNQTPGTGTSGTLNPGTGTSGTVNPGNQTTGSQAANIQQVIDLVNEERAKAGLSPVTEASDVSQAAALRAQETAQSFSHTRPNGTYYTTALDQMGVKYMGSGENIAYGQQTPAAVMSGWMNSQGHRANILDKNFTKIGVGCYENANGVKYWVQLFTY